MKSDSTSMKDNINLKRTNSINQNTGKKTRIILLTIAFLIGGGVLAIWFPILIIAILLFPTYFIAYFVFKYIGDTSNKQRIVGQCSECGGNLLETSNGYSIDYVKCAQCGRLKKW